MKILEYGNKSKDKLLFIHGFESPWQIWNEYIDYYKTKFHVIVPVLPGHDPEEEEDFISFDLCAEEIENFCRDHCGNHVYAVYGMSMGGVLASHIWKNRRLTMEKLILESSPLLSYGKLMTGMLTKQYLSVTHKAQKRDRKTVRRAVNSMVTEEKLEIFLELLDHISDQTIVNYIREIGKFRLPPDIDTPDTQIVYYYGSKPGEMIFRNVARYIERHYPNAKTICLKGKGHCEDALLCPEKWMAELNKVLEPSFAGQTEKVSSETCRLRKELFGEFDGLRKNTIRLSWNQTHRQADVGQSKIGGRPDLPEWFVWPYYKGKSDDHVTANRPLAFLAQINLAEAAFYDRDGSLPKEGLLSFFYELETEKWGFDPEDRGCARVFYLERTEALRQTDFPEDLHQDYRFPEFPVSFESETGLPSYVDFCRLTEDQAMIPEQFLEAADCCDRETYDAFRKEYGCAAEDDQSDHIKLLGYPDVLQDSMEYECEAVTRGIDQGGEQQTSGKLVREIRQGSKDWMLLFQMGTVQKDDFEWMFGDAGHIYFWIRKQDLARKNFENVWLILQCG